MPSSWYDRGWTNKYARGVGTKSGHATKIVNGRERKVWPGSLFLNIFAVIEPCSVQPPVGGVSKFPIVVLCEAGGQSKGGGGQLTVIWVGLEIRGRNSEGGFGGSSLSCFCFWKA
jgi:hypothetical protein